MLIQIINFKMPQCRHINSDKPDIRLEEFKSLTIKKCLLYEGIKRHFNDNNTFVSFINHSQIKICIKKWPGFIIADMNHYFKYTPPNQKKWLIFCCHNFNSPPSECNQVNTSKKIPVVDTL